MHKNFNNLFMNPSDSVFSFFSFVIPPKGGIQFCGTQNLHHFALLHRFAPLVQTGSRARFRPRNFTISRGPGCGMTRFGDFYFPFYHSPMGAEFHNYPTASRSPPSFIKKGNDPPPARLMLRIVLPTPPQPGPRANSFAWVETAGFLYYIVKSSPRYTRLTCSSAVISAAVPCFNILPSCRT